MNIQVANPQIVSNMLCNLLRKRVAIVALIGLTEAARLTGKDKVTIHRAMKSGKLSFTVNDAGDRQIDPAELDRVFPFKGPDDPPRNSGGNGKSNYTQPTARVAALQAQLETERVRTASLQERLADKDAVIDDLRARLDREGEERRKLTAILTDQRPKAPDVMVTPPSSAAIITPPPPEAAPARQDASPAVVKVRPMKKPPAPAKEAGWFRWMMGGR